MTRVLIIDDHPIVLQGCRRILSDLGIADVVEADSVALGYRRALRMRPEIIVTDLTFVGDDLAGLALMKRIAARLPASRLMVFSMHNDPAIVSQALSSGALCYVLKDAPSGEFATAFERILEGKPHLAHDLAVSVAMLRSKLAHRLPGLTERENQIFQLLGAGNGYDRIAARLGITVKTITNATSIMREKLGLASLAELISYARK